MNPVISQFPPSPEIILAILLIVPAAVVCFFCVPVAAMRGLEKLTGWKP